MRVLSVSRASHSLADMPKKRRPDPDATLEVVLVGHAHYLIEVHTPTIEAVAQLRELAGSRADLLASAAGSHLGAYLGSPRTTHPHRLLAGALCVLAGADTDLIDEEVERVRQWVRRPSHCEAGQPA